MKFISTKIHGMLDYTVGVLLIVSPWLFGFYDQTAATYVPMALGAMALVYSMFTNYELGLIKLLPVPIHLLLDILSGIVLAASPWLFGFADIVSLPHLILGIFEIVAAFMTESAPRKR